MNTDFDKLERRMPFSLEAEQSLLGSILIKPACLDDLVAVIKADDFYLPEHSQIFTAMQSMYLKSKNIDVVTLIEELVQSGTYDEAGGREYLKLVAEAVPAAVNAMDYAKIVRDKAVLRQLVEAGEDIAEAAYAGDDDTEALVEYAEGKVFRIAEGRENKSFVHIRDALVQVYDRLTKLSQDPDALRGTPTGFSALDNVIVGMGDSDLVLIGARPGMGKTSFAMNIATEAAIKTKKTVCVFSLEMSAEQLANRMLSSEAQIDSYKMRSGELSGEDWNAIAHASSRLSETDILIDDTPGISVTAMKSKLRRVKNLGLVLIDYLQLMQGDRRNDNRVQEVGDISRGLKLLAKELGVPVVCCAQLSRGPENRPDKRPMLSDLRDSGAIEQDADIVLFLYRDEYYKDATTDQSVAEVIVAKNRHGSLDKVKLGWIGRYTKFTNLARETEA
ncbi:MAG: replicative DNA helicase [Ruminococcaceae bacterium]|nr:replicative DNA helicase [Oscillospiraceae bacterium]